MNPTCFYSISHWIKIFINCTLLCLFSVLLASCSTDPDDLIQEEEQVVNENDLTQTGDRKISIYKGIFAASRSEYRGTFVLKIPGKSDEISKMDPDASGVLTLPGGEK